MRINPIAAVTCISFALLSQAAFSAEPASANVFNHPNANIVKPDAESYLASIKAGSIYQMAVDNPENLLYVSWGYRLGDNPDAGVLAFSLDDLQAKGFLKSVRDVYALGLDEHNNRLLAEHTVSRKLNGGDALVGNSFDVISLADGAKITGPVLIDDRSAERDKFRSHYIFSDKAGNILVSSESRPKKGGPENKQKITMYNSAGKQVWQSKPFPGLVAALVSDGTIIAGADDLYQLDAKTGRVSDKPYAKKPQKGQARYMSLVQGDGVIYASSFRKNDKKDAASNAPYENIYVISKGQASKGFSTVKSHDALGVGSVGLAYNPLRKQLYSANFNDNTVSVIDASRPAKLDHYKNIAIKDAWAINSVVYRNAGEATNIYVGIKGGHGKNVKDTGKNLDDVKIAKITLTGTPDDKSWCKISVLDVKSNKFDYQDRQCDLVNN